MKIRLKYLSTSRLVEISENAFATYTLFDLKTAAVEHFPGIDSSYFLSLNKITPLEDETKTLGELGIVAGDLVHVVALNQPATPSGSVSTNKQPLSSGCSSVSDMFLSCSSHSGESLKCEFSENIDNSSQTSSATRNVTDMITSADQGMDISEESDEYAACSSDQIDHLLVNRYLNEPLLCRESTRNSVPSVLNDFYNSCDVKNPHEALCVVLHVLMLETGFEALKQEDKTRIPTAQPTSSGADDNMTSTSTLWTAEPGRYTLKYTHTSCDADVIFLLTCVPMGNVLVIHGSVSGHQSDKVHINLNTADYVSDIQHGAVSCYKNLSRLSRLFKDAVALCILQQYKSAKGEDGVFGIFALSHEIKLRILTCLDTVSVLRLSQTCKEFLQLSKDRYLWRRLYLKDFGNRPDNSLNHDWQRLYRQEYRLRKERQRIWKRNPIPMFEPPIIPSFGLPTPGPLHPNLIGGDYDLDPFPRQPGGAFFPYHSRGHRGQHQNPPLARPRFDPVGPLPGHMIRPGRRGGPRDDRDPFGGFGGPRLF